jgi:hypothetical protein
MQVVGTGRELCGCVPEEICQNETIGSGSVRRSTQAIIAALVQSSERSRDVAFTGPIELGNRDGVRGPLGARTSVPPIRKAREGAIPPSSN